MQRFGIVQLPDSLQVLSHPIVLGVAITLFVVEFIADKIPYVDSAWDAVHTFIRPPAAAVLVLQRVRATCPEEWKLGAALLAGRCRADLARRQGQHPGRGQYQPGAGQQLGAQYAGGRTGGVSGVDGGGAPGLDSRDRGGAGGSGGAADLEALEIQGHSGPASSPACYIAMHHRGLRGGEFLTQSSPNPPANTHTQTPGGRAVADRDLDRTTGPDVGQQIRQR